MSNGLSYLSLRCLLEHMEPNKRIHIAARSPVLREIDKSIPLNLHVVMFTDNSIHINDISYKIENDQEELPRDHPTFQGKPEHPNLLPGDVQFRLKAPTRTNEYLKLEKRNVNSIHTLVDRIPPNLEKHTAFKCMANVLLGYRTINAFYMGFMTEITVLRVPNGLKIRTKELDIQNNDFEECLQLVDPSSLPLNELRVCLNDFPSLYSNPLAHTADRLVFEDVKDNITCETLLKFPNKTLEVYYTHFGLQAILNLIGGWLEKSRGIGSQIILETSGRIFVLKLMTKAKAQFQGRYENWEGSDIPEIVHSLCIPMALGVNTYLRIHALIDDEETMIKIEEVDSEKL